jgi:hypothetical protein
MKYIYLILIAGLITGCDIFETRDAELPDETRSNYTTPSERTILIQNLINSFSDKNTNNYTKTFSDPNLTDKLFFFNPSSTALRFQIWENWNISDEIQYFNNLINDVPESLPVSLSFSNENYGSVIADSASYTAEYSLIVPQLNIESLVFEGNLKFTMFRDAGGVWSVYFWEDNAIETSISWSELKGIVH